jgi:hypothetical protein
MLRAGTLRQDALDNQEACVPSHLQQIADWQIADCVSIVLRQHRIVLAHLICKPL